MTGIRTLADLKARCVIDDVTGCWVYKARENYRHPVVTTPLMGRSVGLGILIALVTTGKAPDKGMTNYAKCGHKACCNPRHRVIGTKQEAQKHWAKPCPPERRARISLARRAGSSVDESVIEAIRLSDKSASSIAAEHGVSKSYACRIRTNKVRAPLMNGASVFAWRP